MGFERSSANKTAHDSLRYDRSLETFRDGCSEPRLRHTGRSVDEQEIRIAGRHDISGSICLIPIVSGKLSIFVDLALALPPKVHSYH